MNRIALTLGITLLAGPTLAAPLPFSDAPGPALNIARTLLGEERSAPLTDDEKVSVAILDVNGDGTDEIFAFADASYFCGTAGCIPRLYQLDTATMHWNQLAFDTDEVINGEAGMWSTDGTDDSGWVRFTFDGAAGRQVFHWDGTSYVPSP